jgi:hypothetical protein
MLVSIGTGPNQKWIIILVRHIFRLDLEMTELSRWTQLTLIKG